MTTRTFLSIERSSEPYSPESNRRRGFKPPCWAVRIEPTVRPRSGELVGGDAGVLRGLAQHVGLDRVEAGEEEARLAVGEQHARRDEVAGLLARRIDRHHVGRGDDEAAGDFGSGLDQRPLASRNSLCPEVCPARDRAIGEAVGGEGKSRMMRALASASA